MNNFPLLSRPFLSIKINRLRMVAMTDWGAPLQRRCALREVWACSWQQTAPVSHAAYPWPGIAGSPQRLASDLEGGSLCLKVSEGCAIAGRHGAQHCPQCDWRSAQLLGGSGQKLLQSWTGGSRNRSTQILHYLPAAERPDSSCKDVSFPPHLQVATRLLTLFCNTQILKSYSVFITEDHYCY